MCAKSKKKTLPSDEEKEEEGEERKEERKKKKLLEVWQKKKKKKKSFSFFQTRIVLNHADVHEYHDIRVSEIQSKKEVEQEADHLPMAVAVAERLITTLQCVLLFISNGFIVDDRE